MQVTMNNILFSFSQALDYVERELLGITVNHGKRVAYTSMRLGQALGLSDAEIFDLASCAILHDNALTGYMLETGLARFSRLEGLKKHCPLGENNAAGFPFMGDVKGVILYHHENWDGSGYFKMGNADIPLQAAIIRLADNLDLTLGMGEYKPTLKNRIQEHSTRFSASLYAPLVVEAMLDIADDSFIDSVNNANIDRTIVETVPAVGKELSNEGFLSVSRIFATIIDAKSPFTQCHSVGVAAKTKHLAGAFKLDQDTCHRLEVAALLHDIGKLSTPLYILEKKGTLSQEEYRIMQNHAQVSWDILHRITGMEDISRWAASHHEKLNGSGYPLGKMAEKQDTEGRILTVCDIFQALTENRPYRAGMVLTDAARIMREMVTKGELDGDIVEVAISEYKSSMTA